MSYTLESNCLKLEAICGVEEAEEIHEKLLEDPELHLDLSACEHLHAAVFQALLRQPRPIKRAATDSFIKRWLQPQLEKALAEANRD
ncbi:hypothetical protein SAMN05660443_1103 [Marinospirillum celere]|uniref:STAS domain-containing protein n=1 Tax=Marinospirillum celere TaxID=1122252 RepID=A0A1I1FU60_9GAMM|nr:hypothetical protein [Marinospirillum celere]SFC00520.1 hypothetical protein SAMN05660443_1103 [Marinospirillum celere]